MEEEPAPAFSVVMLGATGAVGSQTARVLEAMPGMERLTLLGRRRLEEVSGDFIVQHAVDIFKPDSYAGHLSGHQTAICTLGVGQPSKFSKQEFVRIDKLAVLDFASSCRQAGVRHFQLLGSVGAHADSRSFYLRTKGELEAGLAELGFDRLSLFQPSMILTPTNRYGFSQGVTLAVWPWLEPLLIGPLKKFRGIPVAKLGRAIANNIRFSKSGPETLHWDDFNRLAEEL